MAINFPSNPANNQVYTANAKAWIYTGVAWKSYQGTGTIANTTVSTVTATEGQTVFTTPYYTIGQNELKVFINGIRQKVVTDYLETSNTSITATTAATANDLFLFESSSVGGNPVLVNLPSIVNDASSNNIGYPLFARSNGGALQYGYTSSNQLTYNPSTGTLNSANLSINSVDVLDYIITYNLAFG